MDILHEIKGSVRIDEVAARLGLSLPVRTTNGMLGNCPTGHPSSSGQCFGVNLTENYFNCFNCKVSGDIIKLVEIVRNCDFKCALAWLVQEFRPDLNNQLTKYPPQVDEKRQADYQKAELFEHIYRYGKELLFTPVAEEELDYLIKKRGYDREALQQTEWIYFPPDRAIKQHLLTQFPEGKEVIQGLKLQGYAGDNFRLAFPYRDRNGLITAFIKRATAPEGVNIYKNNSIVQNTRYDSTPGTGAKYDLFNLCHCKKQETLLIVEGYPDALYFQTLGMDNVVAVGQGLLSASHLEGLQAFGVKNVIIAFDNDPPKVDSKTGKEIVTGVENTDKALKLLAKTNIKAFVLPPSWLAPHKDPDEYVKANGIAAFRILTNKAISGAKWHAHRLLQRHNTHTDLGLETARHEAFNAFLGLDVFDRKQYLEIIAEGLNLNQEQIEEELALLQQKKEKEQQIQEYQDFFKKGLQYAESGKIEQISLLMEQQKRLEIKSSDPAITPYSIEAFLEDIITSPEGLKTGFRNLDESLVIPNDAITIIAGRPSHGKTTLMLNMCLNMVEQYPDKSFLFLTYEEPKKHLTLKLLNILSGTVIDEKNNQKMLTRYLRGRHTNRKPIENAKIKLQQYFSEGRLYLVDKRQTAKELHTTLAKFAETNEIGAVFIDYIQKIPSGSQFGTRQLELQNISGQILETATALHIPIILGAQLNREQDKSKPGKIRLENLREAGDIEQDANLVIALYNEAMDKLISGQDAESSDVVPLSLQVLKNRNGIPMLEAFLQFQRSTLEICDHSLAVAYPSRLAA